MKTEGERTIGKQHKIRLLGLLHESSSGKNMVPQLDTCWIRYRMTSQLTLLVEPVGTAPFLVTFLAFLGPFGIVVSGDMQVVDGLGKCVTVQRRGIGAGGYVVNQRIEDVHGVCVVSPRGKVRGSVGCNLGDSPWTAAKLPLTILGPSGWGG